MSYQFLVAGLAGLLALFFAVGTALSVIRAEEGTPRMQAIAVAIREGAMAFLKREYFALLPFVVVVTGVLWVLIDWLQYDSILPRTAISYMAGALTSALAGFLGMNVAIRANVRTAAAAMRGLNPALRVAFSSGAVMGITVVGLGLLGVTILYIIFKDVRFVTGFAFGASSIALFARVGGGIFTKAADVGADLVGKVEAGIPEDDPRNPAVIADNVGDNVGDVAGMGADLFESYVGSIIAAIALAGAAAATTLKGFDDGAYDSGLVLLPLIVAACGIAASIIGTFIVRSRERATFGELLWAIRRGILTAAVIVLLLSLGSVLWLDVEFDIFWAIVSGLGAGGSHRHCNRILHLLRLLPHQTGSRVRRDRGRYRHNKWIRLRHAEHRHSCAGHSFSHSGRLHPGGVLWSGSGRSGHARYFGHYPGDGCLRPGGGQRRRHS